MTLTIQDDFRSLAHASLRVGTALMSDMTDDQLAMIHEAMKGGAQLIIEFGPLPAFERAGLVLVEREGTRHSLGSFDVVHGHA